MVTEKQKASKGFKVKRKVYENSAERQEVCGETQEVTCLFIICVELGGAAAGDAEVRKVLLCRA